MSKDKVKETTPQLKEEILALAEKLEKSMSIDKKTGTAEAVPSDVYYDSLPEGLTAETVDAVSTHNTNFIAAGAYAFGRLGVEAMKSSKSLDKASIEVKMAGKDTVGYTLDRKKNFTNPMAGGETIESMGVISTTYSVKGAKSGSGQLKIARNLISDLAMAKLK